MRAPAPGSAISLASMPAFTSRHSKGSAFPEASAILGMSALLPSPSNRFFGRRELSFATRLSTHELTVERVIFRRHLPICTTRGMFDPDGTLSSLNLPSAPVCASAMADKMPAPAHVSQVAPDVKAGRGVVG